MTLIESPNAKRNGDTWEIGFEDSETEWTVEIRESVIGIDEDGLVVAWLVISCDHGRRVAEYDAESRDEAETVAGEWVADMVEDNGLWGEDD